MTRLCGTMITQFRENPEDLVNYELMEVEMLKQ